MCDKWNLRFSVFNGYYKYDVYLDRFFLLKKKIYYGCDFFFKIVYGLLNF